jgi:glycine dehydrogenase subunit 1
VVVAGHINPDKLSVMVNYGRADLDFVTVPFDAQTGLLDQATVARTLDQQTAAVYVDIHPFPHHRRWRRAGRCSACGGRAVHRWR